MAGDMNLKLSIEAAFKGVQEIKDGAKEIDNLVKKASQTVPQGSILSGGAIGQVKQEFGELGKELQSLVGRLDPLTKHFADFDRELGVLRQGMKDGALSHKDYNQLVERLGNEYQKMEPKARAASEALADVNKNAAGGGTSLKDLGRDLGILGGEIAVLYKLFDFAKDSGKEFANKERLLNQIGTTAARMGQSSQDAAEKAEMLEQALGKVGITGDQTLGVFQEMLLITKDTEQAYSAASLAADISAGSTKSLSEASQILKMALAGDERGLKPAMKELGIEANTTEEALKKLEAQFRGQASALHDTKSAYAGAAEEWRQFKEEVGAGTGPFFATIAQTVVGWVRRIANAFADILAMAIEASRNIVQLAAATIQGFWNGLKTGDFSGSFKSSFSSAFDNIGDEWGALLDNMQEKWNGAMGPDKPKEILPPRDIAAAKKNIDELMNSVSGKNVSYGKLQEVLSTLTALRDKAGEGTKIYDLYNEAIEKVGERFEKLNEKIQAKAEKIKQEILDLRQQLAMLGMSDADKAASGIAGMGGSAQQQDEARELVKAIEAKKEHLRVTQEMIPQLELEIATFRMSAIEKAIYIERTKGATEADLALLRVQLEKKQALETAAAEEKKAAAAAKQHDAELDKQAETLRNSLDPMRQYNKQLSLFDELLKAGKISSAEWTAAVGNIRGQMKKLAQESNLAFQEMRKLGQGVAQQLQSAFAQFLFDPFSSNLKDMLRNFIDTIRQMIAEALAFAAIQAALKAMFPEGSAGAGGGFMTGFLQAFNLHSGGVVGQGGTERLASIFAFADPVRLHNGGALFGLDRDEVPAILLTGEEVLSRTDPRNVLNGGRNAGGGNNGSGGGTTRVINIFDKDIVEDYMGSEKGEKIIINTISKKRDTIKQLIR